LRSSHPERAAAAEGGVLGLHSFHELKKPKNDRVLSTVLPLEGGSEDAAWRKGIVLGEAQNNARRLAEMPANLMDPTIFADTIANEAARLRNVTTHVRELDWIKQQNMNCFLGVAQGSVQPPRFLEVHYTPEGTEDTAPLVLIGKGITFDSGGISIKPSSKMDEMRADMTGAAAVMSAVLAIAKYVTMPLCAFQC
jgi:aminopeptidase